MILWINGKSIFLFWFIIQKIRMLDALTVIDIMLIYFMGKWFFFNDKINNIWNKQKINKMKNVKSKNWNEEYKWKLNNEKEEDERMMKSKINQSNFKSSKFDCSTVQTSSSKSMSSLVLKTCTSRMLTLRMANIIMENSAAHYGRSQRILLTPETTSTVLMRVTSKPLFDANAAPKTEIP